MVFLFYVLSVSALFSVSFLTIANPSFAKTSYTYYLHPNDPSTWYNDNLVKMDNGWKMRIFLVMKNDTLCFYCGFYSSELSSNEYLFSVVAVGEGGSHTVVWSANTNSPVGKNASVQLTDEGLLLRDSHQTVWTSHAVDNLVVGMNLTEEGNLVLFGKEEPLWQSFDHPVDALLVEQRLPNGTELTTLKGLFFAKLTEAANFSAFVNTSKGPFLMYQLRLNSKSSSQYGLHYEDGERLGDRSVVNVGTFLKSYPLEYIECLKLDSDGHLRTYRYDKTEESDFVSIVDLVARECDTGSLDRNDLMDMTYANITTGSDVADKSITTLAECRQACLQKCSCSAIVFKYENDVSDGNCYMPSKLVLVRQNKTNERKSLTFVKVRGQIEALTPPSSPPPSNPSPSTSKDSPNVAPAPISTPSRHRKNRAVISASIAGVFIILLILVSLIVWRKNRSENDGDNDLKQVPGMPLRFSYKEIEIATDNFKEILGSGGFGSVFKGKLADGTRIAVKRLDKMSQGMREFVAEVETIGSLHHFNLVRLVGFCAEKTCRLLVYEHMTNGSLDNWIFNSDQEHYLPWQTRKKIILDIAKGLAYLHEDCRQKIIHFDIKPHNILLDENFNAKVSDFGLSTLINRDESQILTTMKGTPGYLAPEWKELRVTVKVDVYSFGIVLLEIVCKRRNVESSRSESSFHLLKLLQKKAEEDQLIDIVEGLDEDMVNNKEEVVRMIRIGAWCLQNDPAERPFMSTVVKVLEGVMEFNPNICYKFSHATASSPVLNHHVTTAPDASILSAPR